jgi:hypothetical protein
VKGGGQPFAALAVGSRAVVNRKTLCAIVLSHSTNHLDLRTVMAYRNKTFVGFASEDLHFYRLMCAWKENEHIDFDFLDAHDINVARDTSTQETINRRLSERLANTKQVVMLIGDITKTKAARASSFIYHEVQTILRLNLPVIFSNLNKSRAAERSRLPAPLTSRYSISVPFGPRIIQYALDDFPPKYYANQQTSGSTTKVGPHYYLDSVYRSLNL